MISNLKLNITVFISGFVLMVFELVGTRVLAPFLGSSSVVWTSIIGVILAFMSIGYWYGGKIADKHHSTKTLALIITLAAIAILAMNLGKNIILKQINFLEISLIAKSLITSTLLFSIPSFLMAFVSPFAIRLSMNSVEQSGATAGNIYALSTIGSIAGTFSSGFFLIAILGTNQILWILGITLIVLAAFISVPTVKKNSIWLFILLVGNIYYSATAKDYVDIDTNYSRVFITDTEFDHNPAKFLSIDGYVNSGMNPEKPNQLIFEYTQFYDNFEYFNPNFERVVMFGGAGYSYPKHFQEKYANTPFDIIEIDPKLTQIAEEYFQFTASPSTTIIHQDARYFLGNTNQKYDAVLYDVLTSHRTVPFHLTTKETFQEISNIMTNEAVLIMNLIADIDGKGALFLKSEFKTVSEVFPTVFILSAQKEQTQGLNNYMMIALKSNDFKASSNSLKLLLKDNIKLSNMEPAFVLTDDFAPSNYLINQN